MGVLLGDVPGDVDDPPRLVLQLLLLSWLDVAIKHLHCVLANPQLGPTEVGRYGLHHRQLGTRQ